MITGTTSSGFEYAVQSGVAYDAKFVRAAVKMKKATGDPLETAEAAYELIDAVFVNDDEQIEGLMRHLASRSETGRTDIRELVRETNEILKAIQEADESVKKQ